MAEPPPDPDFPDLTGQRTSGTREQPPSASRGLAAQEPQVAPDTLPFLGTPETGPDAFQTWSPQAGLLPDMGGRPEFPLQVPGAGVTEYPSFSTLYYPQAQPGYLDELGDEDEEGTSFMLQRLQQDQRLFQQLEAAYRPPTSELLSQLGNLYQAEELQFSEDTQHGPYLRDDPALQYSQSDLGFTPLGPEVPEPEPRELAIQNAKAYLLQTSIHDDISL